MMVQIREGATVGVKPRRWLIEEKNLQSDFTAKIVKMTPMAYRLQLQSGRQEWVPKSQVEIYEVSQSDTAPLTEVTETGNWIVEEHEGYTGKLIDTRRFTEESEAQEFYHARRNMNKFAGVGGKFTHYWTFPFKDKKATD